MKVESSKVPPGEEDTLKLANNEVSKIKKNRHIQERTDTSLELNKSKCKKIMQ